MLPARRSRAATPDTWAGPALPRRSAAAAAALLLTTGGLLALQWAPTRLERGPEILWLQWPSAVDAQPVRATVPAARATETRPPPQGRFAPTRRPEPPAPASDPTTPITTAVTAAITPPSEGPAAAAAAPRPADTLAAATPPASAASAPKLRLRLEGPAGRAAAVASRSEVQAMAHGAEVPLVHGRVSGQQRLANGIAETAMPACTDPVGGGLLGLPWLVLRPLAGRCK